MFSTILDAKQREEGFTLIELLVVVIIIGILAAIAIPVFLSQREKAWDSAASADLRNLATSQEAFATENNGTYTTAAADLAGQGFRNSDAVTVQACVYTVTGTTGNTGYYATAKHDSSTTTYHLDSQAGVQSDTAPTSAPCTAADLT